MASNMSEANNLGGYWGSMSFQDRLIFVMVIAIIGLAFFLGLFYGQLSALKGGSGSGPKLNLFGNNEKADPVVVADTGEQSFGVYADALDLNRDDLEQCLADETYASAVDADLALAAQVGASGTPTFFINGHILVGAQPYEAFEAALNNALEGKPAVEVDPSTGATGEPVSDELWQQLLDNPAASKGPDDAAVTLVEYTDYQCPFCQRHFQQTSGLIEENYVDNGKIRYITKDLPLSFHPNAHAASQAARCAGDQGKYWEMHDALFENQQSWSNWTI